MIFEDNKFLEKLGVISGYIFSYLLFTTVLFYVLLFLGKIHKAWSFFHVVGITALIVLIGIILRKYLK